MKHTLETIISERITYLRKQKNMTIEQLAYQSDISKGGLSEIERKMKQPTIFVITKICAGLGITLTNFFDTDEFNSYMDQL